MMANLKEQEKELAAIKAQNQALKRDIALFVEQVKILKSINADLEPGLDAARILYIGSESYSHAVLFITQIPNQNLNFD